MGTSKFEIFHDLNRIRVKYLTSDPSLTQQNGTFIFFLMKKVLKYVWKIQLVRVYLWCMTGLNSLCASPASVKVRQTAPRVTELLELWLIFFIWLFNKSYNSSIFFCHIVIMALIYFFFVALTSKFHVFASHNGGRTFFGVRREPGFLELQSLETWADWEEGRWEHRA